MIARIAVWEPMPTDDRNWLTDAVRGIPGVVAGYHLIDPATGNGLSVSIYEDEQALAATKAAIERAVEDAGVSDQPRPAPVSVTMYEVMRNV